MHVIARSVRQPLLHFRVFMRAVVVEDEVDIEAGVDGLIDPVEKAENASATTTRLSW